MKTTYRTKGAQHRIRDVLDKMQNKPVVVKPLVYTTQEIDAAKAVLLRIMRRGAGTNYVASTTNPAKENSDEA